MEQTLTKTRESNVEKLQWPCSIEFRSNVEKLLWSYFREFRRNSRWKYRRRKQIMTDGREEKDRRVFWKAFEEEREGAEENNLLEFQQAFKEEQKRLEKLFREREDTVHQTLIFQEINNSMSDWERAFIRSAAHSMAFVVETFPNNSRRFRERLEQETIWLLEQTIAEKISGIQNNTRKTIANLILDQVKKGATINQVQSVILDKYNDWIGGGEKKASRALTIARTETGAVGSYTQYKAGIISGYTKKIWITSRDQFVRGTKPTDVASHVVLDGEVRAMDIPFSNGLMMPLDPNSRDAGQVINCRCSMSFLDD